MRWDQRVGGFVFVVVVTQWIHVGADLRNCLAIKKTRGKAETTQPQLFAVLLPFWVTVVTGRILARQVQRSTIPKAIE